MRRITIGDAQHYVLLEILTIIHKEKIGKTYWDDCVSEILLATEKAEQASSFGMMIGPTSDNVLPMFLRKQAE